MLMLLGRPTPYGRGNEVVGEVVGERCRSWAGVGVRNGSRVVQRRSVEKLCG